LRNTFPQCLAPGGRHARVASADTATATPTKQGDPGSSTPRSRVCYGLLVAAIASLLPAATAVGQPAVTPPPQVVHTGTAPTGYEVTFKVHDPTAKRLRIKGEWSFASEASSLAVHLPTEWRPGDFPLTSPIGANENWPVADMTFDAATGMWSYTTPLPAGTFMYWLYRDCDAAAPELVGCTPQADPANPPWSPKLAVSTVYVPLDPAFGADDYSWSRPAATKGMLRTATYPSPLSTDPPGIHELAVYTPPGYNPHRRVPYPLMIISHGGNGNEADWYGRGAAANIFDNLIADGKMQPAVVAATNYNGLPGGNAGYATEVVTNVIPYMGAHYNVSTDPDDMAFAGLSGGGQRGNELLFNNTTQFGYYGIFSPSGTPPEEGDPRYNNPELKTRLGIFIGVGFQDVRPPGDQRPSLATNVINEQARLAAAGVPFVKDNQNGGHTWWFWRIMLHDFTSTVAFRTTTTSVVANVANKKLTATIAPATRQPATPTGTVQFLADGKPLGKPVRLKHGQATLSGHTARRGAEPWWHARGSRVSAVYSGDTLYNSSTSAGVKVTPRQHANSAGPSSSVARSHGRRLGRAAAHMQGVIRPYSGLVGSG
jgi:enterochelin esterase-like enzyme